MSQYAFKAGVYCPIRGIGITTWNKAKIVDFFAKLECSPEDYDPENIDEEEALYFEEKLNSFHPRHIFTDTVNMWIVEYIMAWDEEGIEPEFAIAPSTMDEIAEIVSSALGINTHPVAFSYMWYTGIDEPFIQPMDAKPSSECRY
jgi:hypothetical protein